MHIEQCKSAFNIAFPSLIKYILCNEKYMVIFSRMECFRKITCNATIL